MTARRRAPVVVDERVLDALVTVVQRTEYKVDALLRGFDKLLDLLDEQPDGAEPGTIEP